MINLKRPAALAAAAVAVAALAACSSASAAPTADPATESIADSAASAAPEVEVLTDVAPLSVDEYVAQFSATRGWLDNVDEVNEEYRAAAAAFPLALPEGYAWPATSWLVDDGQGGSWQQGNGVGQAYFYWQMATATAAYAAHERGDEDAAAAYLAALEDGYTSSVRSMFLHTDSPGTSGPWLEHVLAPAQSGDWSALVEQEVEPFLADAAYGAIAEQAGDTP